MGSANCLLPSADWLAEQLSYGALACLSGCSGDRDCQLSISEATEM